MPNNVTSFVQYASTVDSGDLSRFRRVRETFKEVTPIFESFTDSKHFAVIDVVVAFSFGHRLRTIRNRVPETVSVFL